MSKEMEKVNKLWHLVWKEPTTCSMKMKRVWNRRNAFRWMLTYIPKIHSTVGQLIKKEKLCESTKTQQYNSLHMRRCCGQRNLLDLKICAHANEEHWMNTSNYCNISLATKIFFLFYTLTEICFVHFVSKMFKKQQNSKTSRLLQFVFELRKMWKNTF